MDLSDINAILVVKGDVAVLDLNRDGHEDCIIGHLYIIGAHIKGEVRTGEQLVVRHERFKLKVLELDDRRSLQFCILLKAVKLLALLHGGHGAGAERFETTAETI